MRNPQKQIFMIALTLLAFLLPMCASSRQNSTLPPPAQTGNTAEIDANTYIIGPEDVINIFVWKEESLTKTIPVRIDGKISLPLTDDIQAAGLTPMQLKEVITNKLKNYIENPTVSITVIEANSYKASISGQVKNPGIFRLRSETSFLQLIIMAGGFTDWADQKNITIIRTQNGVEKRITVNYKKIIEGEAPDLTILRGDTVIVP